MEDITMAQQIDITFLTILFSALLFFILLGIKAVLSEREKIKHSTLYSGALIDRKWIEECTEITPEMQKRLRSRMFSKSSRFGLSKGYLVYPNNFILEKKIESLDEFWDVINNKKSIYARHRMYPTAFFFSWNIKLIKKWMDNGWFWTAKKFDNHSEIRFKNIK